MFAENGIRDWWRKIAALTGGRIQFPLKLTRRSRDGEEGESVDVVEGRDLPCICFFSGVEREVVFWGVISGTKG
jgi:hypothetical protein